MIVKLIIKGQNVAFTSLDQVQGFLSNATNSCLLFYSINRCMSRSYDHLQVEILTSLPNH
jgi:hypothetical protein